MFKKYVLTALSLLLLTSCSNIKNNESIYLSIAAYDRDSLTMYTFDIDTKQLKKYETVKTTNVDQAAIIDPDVQTIYYSDRNLLGDKTEFRYHDGDNIYSYNYKKQITTKLTDGTRFLKLEDQLLIPIQGFVTYDLPQHEPTNFKLDPDIFFVTYNINPITKEFVTTAISYTESIQKRQQYETTNLYENTKNKLYTYKNGKLQYITETKPGNIKTIAINDSYIIYHLFDETIDGKETYSQQYVQFDGFLTYNRLTHETTSGILNVNDPNINQLLYLSKDQTYLICTYKKNTNNSNHELVKYNLNDQTYEVLLTLNKNLLNSYMAVIKK